MPWPSNTRAYTRLGEKVKGVLDTDSEEDAYGILEKGELIPYRLSPVRRRRSLVQVVPGLFKPKPQDVINFTRQLGALLNSGIPLRPALVVQQEQSKNPGLKEALRQIVQDVEAGGPFNEAFAKHTSVFPEFYLRMLRVGEATGGIPLTLEQLTDNLQRRKDIADKIRKALVYPAISLVVAFIASFVLVTYALPSLTGLLKEFGGELPTMTKLLISISDTLQEYTLFIIVPPIALAMGAGFATRSARGRSLRDHFLLRIPVVGGILLGSSMFYLTNTLSTLLKGGVSPIEAMKLAEQGLGNAVIRERLARVTARATEGMKLGEAFGEQRGFPSILAQAIVTGEMRGNIADTLGGLAEYYEDVTDRSVSGATELIQPAVILVVASVVGFVAVAVISGIYSTLGSVG